MATPVTSAVSPAKSTQEGMTWVMLESVMMTAGGFRVLKGTIVCSGLVLACVEASVGTLCSEKNVF